MSRPLYIYVDVDETLVRNYGAKRIPIPAVIKHVEVLHSQGAILYCWDSGGAGYAREVTRELGVEHAFAAFLPKPHVLIDDMKLADWRFLKEVHSNLCSRYSLEDDRALLFG